VGQRCACRGGGAGQRLYQLSCTETLNGMVAALVPASACNRARAITAGAWTAPHDRHLAGLQGAARHGSLRVTKVSWGGSATNIAGRAATVMARRAACHRSRGAEQPPRAAPHSPSSSSHSELLPSAACSMNSSSPTLLPLTMVQPSSLARSEGGERGEGGGELKAWSEVCRGGWRGGRAANLVWHSTLSLAGRALAGE